MTEGTALLQPDPPSLQARPGGASIPLPSHPARQGQGAWTPTYPCNEMTRYPPLPARCQEGPVVSQDSGPEQQGQWRPGGA